MNLLGIFSFLFILLNPLVVSAERLNARACNKFTPSGELFTSESKGDRISPALICNTPGTSKEVTSPCSASMCGLGSPAGTFISQPTLNFSLSSAETDSVYKTVGEATGLNFTSIETTYHQGETSFCFYPGQARYVAVKYSLNCTIGVLSTCDGGKPAEGTFIQACTPQRVITNGIAQAFLEYSSPDVSAKEAENMTDNPFPAKSSPPSPTIGPLATISPSTTPNAANRVAAIQAASSIALVGFAAIWLTS